MMPTVPTPILRGEEAIYFQRARAHELVYQMCRNCGSAIWYLRSVCPSCMSDGLEVCVSDGQGTVYSFTTLHRPGHPTRSADVPYSVALVELDEGVRVIGNLRQSALSGNPIGARCRAEFDDVSDDLTLIAFALLAESER